MSWAPRHGRLGERLDVVGVGEAMLLLQAPPPETLVAAEHLRVDVAGAELNACAAVSRLGGRTAFLTRVGDDPPGQRVARAVTELGVESGLAMTDPMRPTGLFLRETPADGTRKVVYYRQGSAAAAMDSADAERLWRGQAPRALVLSGLTAALAAGPRELVRTLAEQAAAHGTAVVVDVNLRPSLGDAAEALTTVRDVLPRTDLLVLGDDESEPLFGVTAPAEVFAAAAAAGVGETVLKGGARGCWYLGQDGEVRHQVSGATEVVDPIGAGDAFLGGYLAARLAGAVPAGAAVLGSTLAAGVVGMAGDTAGLPAPGDAQRALAESLAT